MADTVYKLVSAASDETKDDEHRRLAKAMAVCADPLDQHGFHSKLVHGSPCTNFRLGGSFPEKQRLGRQDRIQGEWYPFGNTPAVNFLGTRCGDVSVLSVASGDLRHVLNSLDDNGNAYKCSFLLNDIDAYVVARNVLFLVLLDTSIFDEPSLEERINLVIALWYSAYISEHHFTMLRQVLDVLVAHSRTAEGSWLSVSIQLDEASRSSVISVWQTWRNTPKNAFVPWCLKPATSCMMMDCCKVQGRWHRCMKNFLESHVLGHCCASESKPCANATLIHPTRAVAKGCVPFRGWSLHILCPGYSRHIAENPDQHEVCLGTQLQELLQSKLKRLHEMTGSASIATSQVHFKFHVGDAVDLAESLEKEGAVFDIVSTSNIADYIGVSTVLEKFACLTSKVLITEFMNWAESSYVPRLSNEVSKVSLPNGTVFCTRALRYCQAFPRGDFNQDVMFDLVLLREMIWAIKSVTDEPTDETCRILQQMRTDMETGLSQNKYRAWQVSEALSVLQKLGSFRLDVPLARWGLVPSDAPKRVDAHVSVFSSGDERTIEWIRPHCFRSACCQKVGPRMRCSACHKAWYCSVGCQKIAWQTHKFFCKAQIVCG